MTHRANQSEVDDISSKLKFVAKIQPDQRVNVKNSLSLHDKNSWTVRFWRTYKGNEGRQATYEFIKELIDRAYELLSSLRHSVSDYDLEVYKKIVTELIQIEPGLRNLTKTYHKDDEYVTTIETLIDSLKIKIRELCDYKNIDSVALTAKVQINLDESEAISDEDTEKKKINKAFTSSGSDSSESDQNSLRNSEDWTDGEECTKKNFDLKDSDSESENDHISESDNKHISERSYSGGANKCESQNVCESLNACENLNACKSLNICENQIDTHCAIESVSDANSHVTDLNNGLNNVNCHVSNTDANSQIFETRASNTCNTPVSTDKSGSLSEDTLLSELINSFKHIDWVDNGIQNTPYYNNVGQCNDCKFDNCKYECKYDCNPNQELIPSHINQYNTVNANPPKEESFIKLIADNEKQMDKNNIKIIPDTVNGFTNTVKNTPDTPVKNSSTTHCKLPAIETDEALLEILNKVNLGARRRGKRKKTGNQDTFHVECHGQQCQGLGQQCQGLGQQCQGLGHQCQGQHQGQDYVPTPKLNPYNALKYDFTYDLESGLQLPRAPLVRNAPNDSTQLKKKVV